MRLISVSVNTQTGTKAGYQSGGNKTESGKLVVPLTYEVSESSLSSRARSELGERYRVSLLEVTLGVVMLMALKTAGTARRTAAERRQARPYPRAADHAGVRLPVLLVHDHVDDRVHARREVQQQVSQNMAL